jgi:hypothetical protein
MPRKFAQTIESVLNQYSSNREVFRKMGRGDEDDLFYSPERGDWMLHSDERAGAWYTRRTGEDL